MRAILLCALWLSALPAWSGDSIAARKLLQTCSDNTANDAVGLEKLEVQCPGMHAALAELGFAGQLHRGWEDRVDVHMVSDLLALHARYATTQNSRGPQTESLQTILAKLRDEGADKSTSRWERFKTWLRDLFRPASDGTPGWLERVVKRLTVSAAIMKIILYSLIALVIAMAIAVVLNELRAAGAFGKRGIKMGEARRVKGEPFPLQAVSLADAEAAPWVERPAILLRLLIARLLENRQLRGERSLTHRELGRRAQFAKPTDRVRFEQLALLAEALRFGGEATRTAAFAERSQGVLADARALLSELKATSGDRAS